MTVESFDDIMFGTSEMDAVNKAKRWERLFPTKYRVANIKTVIKPTLLSRILFIRRQYAVSFTVFSLSKSSKIKGEEKI